MEKKFNKRKHIDSFVGANTILCAGMNMGSGAFTYSGNRKDYTTVQMQGTYNHKNKL